MPKKRGFLSEAQRKAVFAMLGKTKEGLNRVGSAALKIGGLAAAGYVGYKLGRGKLRVPRGRANFHLGPRALQKARIRKLQNQSIARAQTAIERRKHAIMRYARENDGVIGLPSHLKKELHSLIVQTKRRR